MASCPTPPQAFRLEWRAFCCENFEYVLSNVTSKVTPNAHQVMLLGEEDIWGHVGQIWSKSHCHRCG